MDISQIGGVLQAASPLLGLIPGAGAPLAMAGSAAGSIMSAQHEAPSDYTPALANQQPYGRRYATGGDVNLSNDAFEVNYPGNKPDNKVYQLAPNNALVRFDNKEVFDKSKGFVFSNLGILGSNDKSPAKLAKPYYRALGKIEKKPADKINKTTEEYNKAYLAKIAMKQEEKATALGFRNNNV